MLQKQKGRSSRKLKYAFHLFDTENTTFSHENGLLRFFMGIANGTD